MTRPTLAFTFRHPLHTIALGCGAGLSPWAPGTAGTLWAWATFGLLSPWLSDVGWALFLMLATVLGVGASTVTARHLGQTDPSAVVWDEIVAFWAILWLISPAGWGFQCVAFALFRYFDAAKPGPVRWADQYFKGRPDESITWRQGVGIMMDDLVAAGCTLLVCAIGLSLSR